jgi:hypothetical protein
MDNIEEPSQETSKDFIKGVCLRKITHKCRYNPETRLIIVANDYSKHGSLSTISCVLNDVTLVWNYFKRYHCMSDSQITVLGVLDFEGKMIPWKHRYNAKITSGVNYLYYTGHGYADGSIDINSDDMPEICLSIIDSCYSHKWKGLTEPYIVSSCDGNAISMSTPILSIFTYELIKMLIKSPSYEEFSEWSLERKFPFKISEVDFGRLIG